MKLFGSSFLLSLIFSLMSVGMAQTQPQLNLMPMPASVQPGSGQLAITQSFFVSATGYRNAALATSIDRFQQQLSEKTGIPFRLKPGVAPALEVHAESGLDPVLKLGEDESYELTINESKATLTAPTWLGVLHGLQTFLQLVEITPTGFAVPSVTIKDQPRFPWRGLMIDVSRHFIPIDVLKRNLDGMAAAKMNVLHWHLSDDQGFRAESKKFPRLTGMGSEGQFYTQDEIREFIAYAHDRGIRVIPEFDIPGHSRSWFLGYPDLSSGSGPYTLEGGAAIDPIMDPTRETTYKFLEKFIAEMAQLFPDAYFHIGGDEVDGKQWDANPKIQAFKQAHGLKNNQDLQAYFNQRLQKILAKNHKIMVGWDEILHPDLPKTIVVHSWRGQDSLAAAAKQGYSGLLSFGYYLDLMWPAARHYEVDPMSGAAAALSPEEKNRILGGESCQWAEWVTPENIDSHIWPRNAAIAERLWSPQSVTDVSSMYARMDAESARLEWLGLTHNTYYRQMLQRIAGRSATPQEFAALHTLADVVEPVKDYAREQLATTEPTSGTALNRVVDAVALESDAGRRFAELVERYLAAGCKDEDSANELRAQLTRWRDNDVALESLAQKSFLVKEVVPVSQDLATTGKVGIAALDYLILGAKAPGDWKTDQLALLTQLQKPKGQLLLIPVPAVQRLV